MIRIIPEVGLPFGTEEIKEFLNFRGSSGDISGFESSFKKKIGVKYAYSTYMGRAALYVILKSLKLKKDDEVIVPSLVFEGVMDSMLLSPVKPVLVDIDRETYTMDIEDLKERISPKTKAVIPVHTYGNPCDMKQIGEIAQEHNIYVIEDCAPSLGGQYEGKKLGSLGDVSFFSFDFDKNISTGYGGMIATCHDDMAKNIENNLQLLKECSLKDRLRVRRRLLIFSLLPSRRNLYSIYRSFYQPIKKRVKPRKNPGDPGPVEIYLNRMAPEVANIGSMQLNKLDEMNELRIKNAKKLSRSLSNNEFLQGSKIRKNSKHVFSRFVVKVKENSEISRDMIVRWLNINGIEARTSVWPYAMHQIPRFKNLFKNDSLSFPYTEDLLNRFFQIPVHPLLTKDDMERMTKCLNNLDLALENNKLYEGGFF